MPPTGLTKVCAYSGNVYLDSFARHCEEILNGGFNTILICISEDLIKWNSDNLLKMINIAKYKGLDVWLNLWGIAGIFDGEAINNNNRPCFCNLNTLFTIKNSLNKIKNIICSSQYGVSTILWDNPKIKCPYGCKQSKKLKTEDVVLMLVHDYQISNVKNYVYLSAVDSFDRNNIDVFDKVAQIYSVNGIGSDTYQLGETPNIEKYPIRYSKIVQAAALKNNKDGFIWVQGFGLKHGQEELPIEAAEQAIEDGIKIIGFWGFRACEGISCISPANASLVWSRACNFFRSI